MTKQERIILFLLASLNFTHILDFIVMVPLSTYLVKAFSLSAFQWSVLVASYSVSAFFSGLFVSVIIDKFDRKKALLVAYTFFLLATLACGVSVNFEMLLISRIMAGIFGGVLGAQVLAIVSDLFTYERRGAAMGAVMSAFAIAIVGGVPFSMWLTGHFNDNWKLPFLVIGGVGIVLLPMMARYMPSMKVHLNEEAAKNSEKKNIVKTILLSLKHPALVFSFLFMLGHFMVIPFIPNYLKYNKLFSEKDIMYIYLFGGIASFISAIVLGKLSDKKGKLPVFIWSVISSLFLIVLLTNMPDMYLPVALVFFSLLFIVVTVRTVMAQAMISEMVDAESRGSFMSVNGSVQQLGQGLGALVAGTIVQTNKATQQLSNYQWVGYLSIVVLVASLIMGKVVFKDVDKCVAEVEEEEPLVDELVNENNLKTL